MSNNYIENIKKQFKTGRKILIIASLISVTFLIFAVKELLSNTGGVNNSIYTFGVLVISYNLYEIRQRYKENRIDEKRLIESELYYQRFKNTLDEV